ncbi:MAG: globin family protein [Methylococcales bacterium]|nr:globin family protein [Methylococcales bacterium]
MGILTTLLNFFKQQPIETPIQPVEMPLSAAQIGLLRDSWAKVLPIKEQASQLFYDKLFGLDPNVRPLFKTDIKQQGDKLIASLNRVVNAIDKMEQVTPILQDMGVRHLNYGVVSEHYNTVATALLWTLEQGLGDGFTDEVKEAWTVTYTSVTNIMIGAADLHSQQAQAAAL